MDRRKLSEVVRQRVGRKGRGKRRRLDDEVDGRVISLAALMTETAMDLIAVERESITVEQELMEQEAENSVAEQHEKAVTTRCSKATFRVAVVETS